MYAFQLQLNLVRLIQIFLLLVLFSACQKDEIRDPSAENCMSEQILDNTRGACNESLNFQSVVTINLEGSIININSNCIPSHKVGLFGKVQGALNPNAITPQEVSHKINSQPSIASSFTPLLGSNGPNYAFGIHAGTYLGLVDIW